MWVWFCLLEWWQWLFWQATGMVVGCGDGGIVMVSPCLFCEKVFGCDGD